jgi:hypothetical protein
MPGRQSTEAWTCLGRGLKALQDGNTKLRRLLADAMLDNVALTDKALRTRMRELAAERRRFGYRRLHLLYAGRG